MRSGLCALAELFLLAYLSTGGVLAQDLPELKRKAAGALSAGQYPQAIDILRKAREMGPADTVVAFNLGLAYVKMARFNEAIEPLRQSLSDARSADKAAFLLGTAYYETGQFPLAAAQLEHLRAIPEYAENALYLLEETYRKSRNGAQAERAFSELVTRYPESALVHKLVGTAYDADRRYPEALAEFQKAAQRDPTLPEVHFDIGLLYLKLHDDVSARISLEQELKSNPCFAAALYYLAEIERRADQVPAAAQAYRKATVCAPDYPDAWLGLGIALTALRQDAEALHAFERAVTLAPSKSESHFQLARALARAGRTEESRAELQKARQLAAAQEEQDAARLRK